MGAVAYSCRRTADANGRAGLQLTLGPQYQGNYTFVVYTLQSSVTSRLITVCTQPRNVAAVQVVTQPAASSSPGDPSLVGNFFGVQPAVRVVDSAGLGVANVSVFASFVNDDCSAAPAMTDISNLFSLALSNVYGMANSPMTDATGLTSYRQLGFLDALSGCYRVLFLVVVGTVPSFSMVHAVSDPVCVVNLDVVTVTGQPSKVTSAGAALAEPFTISLTRRYQSDLVQVTGGGGGAAATPLRPGVSCGGADGGLSSFSLACPDYL
jgi:hypothetical protein